MQSLNKSNNINICMLITTILKRKIVLQIFPEIIVN